MKKHYVYHSLAAAIMVALTGCSTPTAFNAEKKQIVDADLMGGDANALFWTDSSGQVQKRELVFDIVNDKIKPLGDLSVLPPSVKNNKDLRCVTNIDAYLCGDFNNDGFTKSNLNPFNLIDTAIKLPFGITADALSTVTGRPSVRGTSRAFDAWTDTDREMIKKVSDLVKNSIVDEYNQTRHKSPEKLFAFKDKYRVLDTHKTLYKDVAKGYSQMDISSQILAEATLVNKNFVKVQTLSQIKAKGGSYRDRSSSGIWTSASIDSTSKDYQQKFSVSLDQNLGLPIKYNNYKVDLKFSYIFKYSDGTNKGASYTKTVWLKPTNNYQADVEMNFTANTAYRKEATTFFFFIPVPAVNQALLEIVADEVTVQNIEAINEN